MAKNFRKGKTMKTHLPKRRLCPGDFIAVGAVVIICAVSFLFLLTSADKSGFATVTTTVETFEIDLSADTEKKIYSNGYSYTVKIEDGRIYVIDADCPDGTCKSMKPVTEHGGSIVCIPGKMTIVTGGKGGSGNADLIVP